MMRKPFRLPIVSAALLLLLVTSGLSPAYGGEASPSALVGQSRIALLPPPGLAPAEGRDPRNDRPAEADTARGSRLLAVYAEPETWRAYLAGPEALDYYALISIGQNLVEQDISPEIFTLGNNEDVIPRLKKLGAEILANEPRYFIYRISLASPGAREELSLINTTILVEKKMLTLSLVNRGGGRLKNQLDVLALMWAEDYVQKTNP